MNRLCAPPSRDIHVTVQKHESGRWSYTLAARGQMWMAGFATRDEAWAAARAHMLGLLRLMRIAAGSLS